jgi:WD40 repeat protein
MFAHRFADCTATAVETDTAEGGAISAGGTLPAGLTVIDTSDTGVLQAGSMAAYSPDGTRVLTMSYAVTRTQLKLFNAADLRQPLLETASAHPCPWVNTQCFGDEAVAVRLRNAITRANTGACASTATCTRGHTPLCLICLRASSPTGVQLPKLIPRVHTPRALVQAWSPDNARIATIGPDGAIRVWSATSFLTPLLERTNVRCDMLHCLCDPACDICTC